MSITIRYFASLRERVGKSSELIDAGGIGTVAELWARAHGGEPLPANLLAAVNQEYAEASDPVRDGDEVAFFPPVTGG